MKIRLKEIKIVDLDSKSVIMLTRFVRLARRQGADLMMQQPDVVKRVFSYAAKTDNPELIVLFMRLRKHLIKFIVKANLEKPSFNVYPNTA